MAIRVWVLCGAVAWLAVACSGDADSPEVSSTTTVGAVAAVESTTPSGTVAPPESVVTTTSTTVASSSTAPATLAIDEWADPTDSVDSFSFEYSVLEYEDGPFGIVSLGVFVTPDAVSCEAGNPGLAGGSLGTGVAIGDVFWFDDGFMTPRQDDRSDESPTQWLAWCPSAPEYWTQPIFLDERFSTSYLRPGKEIEGFATQVYAVESASPEVVVDEGLVWVTEEGWPIQIAIAGEMFGGVFSFFGVDDTDDLELPDQMVPFEIGLVIGEINAPRHMVRAPDGSVAAGPLGDVTASLPDAPPPTGELADKIDEALDTNCVRADSIRNIAPGPDLTILQPSQVSVSTVDGNLTQTYPGMAYGGSPTFQVVTTSGPEAAELQTDVLFNHRAPLAALMDWTGYVPPEWRLDDQLHISIASSVSADGAIDIAAWNGQRISYPDRPVYTTNYYTYLSPAIPLLALSDTAETEAYARLSNWTTAVSDIVESLPGGDLQAAANLEALYDDLDSTKALACTLLATEWTATDEAFADNAPDATLYERLADQVSMQHSLLAIEYVNAIGRYLDQPDIDWFRANDIDFDNGFLAGDTTGTILDFFADLTTEAISYSDPATYW